MLHKFYNTKNISSIFLTPYCKIVENTENRIEIVNTNTSQQVVLTGDKASIAALDKAFILNTGMEYAELSSFFSQFDNCTTDTWLELIQGGFLE